MSDEKIAVVVPAYKAARHIGDVVNGIPDSVDHIIVVDDACPENTGNEAEITGRQNLTVLYHDRNRGVGGATITGFKKASEMGCDIVVKMDADGQMDPAYLESLTTPLIADEADYAKGNRFRDFTHLRSMPAARFLANSLLSFFIKLASGYWDIMDPTNGYVAIHRRALERLNLDKIDEGYFFESDMLVNLNIANAVVCDVAIPAKYGDEESSIRPSRLLMQFPFKILRRLLRRVALKYFIHDFNMASIYMLLGLPMFLFSLVFGISEWIDSYVTGIARPAGTIMLAALPIIVSFQMLLQAINIDINSVPRKRNRN